MYRPAKEYVYFIYHKEDKENKIIYRQAVKNNFGYIKDFFINIPNWVNQKEMKNFYIWDKLNNKTIKI